MPRSDPLPQSCQERSPNEPNNNSDGRHGSNVADNAYVCSISEHGAVSSRCSIRLIHDIISNFSLEKIQLVRSTGFEGILHIPFLKQINLKFSTWLMSRVDVLTQTLVIADGSGIKFSKDDVSCIFGIPCSGISIFSSEAKLDRSSVGLEGRCGQAQSTHFRSIKAAQAIVCRQYEFPMSSMEQDEFRAAFVVFVMSTLLAPCAKHDRVSDDYIHAVQIPDKIRSYDWAEYVLRRLLDAVAKFKSDIANNVKTPYIYGCSLLLQILYLDSIDLGMLSMAHDKFPRVRCFTSDRLRSMIAADASFSLNGHNMFEARRIKLRKGDEICYYWARSQSRVDASSSEESRRLDLWDLAVTMTRVLKIPPEASWPLYIAASDFQRQIKCSECPDALKVMDVLLHIVEPYVNGFSYQSSASHKRRPIDLCYLGQVDVCKDSHCGHNKSSLLSKRKQLYDVGDCSSHFNNGDDLMKRSCITVDGSRKQSGFDKSPAVTNGGVVASAETGMESNMQHSDMRAINVMAKFYLAISRSKGSKCPDLNVTPIGEDRRGQQCSHFGARLLKEVRSPWELGFRCKIDLDKASEILGKLQSVEDNDEPWICHYCPKYIEVITQDFKEQFYGKAEFELELVDAVIRRFRQLDDELYAGEGHSRWRHFVESDFMVSMLAGLFHTKDPLVPSHFSGDHINYDVTSCRILFFPLILHHRWVCFAWRMDVNTIVVYDPCIPSDAQSVVIDSYERVVNLLKTSMRAVAAIACAGWSYDWDAGNVEVFDNGNSAPPGTNRTGLMCLHFCRCYDGVNINPPIDPALIQDWATTILCEVSLIHGNVGLARKLIS